LKSRNQSKKENKMNYLLARMSEPSSHAGLAAVLQAFSYFFPQYNAVLTALAVLFGGVAIATPAKGD
jgi:hypothetical protein